MIKVLLTGGGSGGHVYPLLSVYDELAHEKNEEFRVFFMGPKSIYDEEFLNRDIPVFHILGSKLRRYFSFKNIIDIPLFLISIIQALIQMFRIMPNVVFSKGGSGAFPVVLAARFYFIPVIIHESDAFPGLTNRLSTRFAKRIAVSFPDALQFFPKEKTALVGNPIRSIFFSEGYARDHSKQHFGLDGATPTLLFAGGSQGAEVVNNLVLSGLQDFLREYQVIHVSGKKNFADVERVSKVILEEFPEEKKHRYKLFEYLEQEELCFAYSAADVIISRAGSGSIFEIAAFGRASLLVPHGASNGHQGRNAWSYAKTGAAIVVESENFSTHIILLKANDILKTEGLQQRMEMAAKKFATPNAAKILAAEIIHIGKGY